jgi:hypothetical protein
VGCGVPTPIGRWVGLYSLPSYADYTTGLLVDSRWGEIAEINFSTCSDHPQTSSTFPEAYQRGAGKPLPLPLTGAKLQV